MDYEEELRLDFATFWLIPFREFGRIRTCDFLAMCRPLRYKEHAAFIGKLRWEEREREENRVPPVDLKRQSAAENAEGSADQLQSVMDQIMAQAAAAQQTPEILDAVTE